MKRYLQRHVLICALFVFLSGMLVQSGMALPSSSSGSNISFASRDSIFSVAKDARLNVTSSNLSINGTLVKDEGAEISGSTIAFNGGKLSSDGLEAVLTGSFDPTGTDVIQLHGSSRFNAEPGTVIEGISVAGTGNTIEGQPEFSSPIVLTNSATELSLGLQSALNQSIEMNGGTIRLTDHLTLDDNVGFIGDGQVELNNRQLRLGSVYASPWSNSLYFNNAADLVLNGTVDLTGTWTFGGTCVLSGNGSILDVSKGGKLILDSGAKLLLNNVFLAGLGNSAGKIVFNDNTGQVRLANSTVRLDDNVLDTKGTVYVNGPTTFELGDHNWTFSNNANLTVDGTVLWLDYMDNPASLGTIWAPRPLFDGHVWNKNNLLVDLAAGNLSLVNRGTIKEAVDMSVVPFDPAELALLSGHFSGFIQLSRCLCLGFYDIIRVVGDGTIDGRGVPIKFNEVGHAQLVLLPGVSLTLMNLSFINLNNMSFDLGDNSTLVIDQNVIWQLSADITLGANAKIIVVDGATGVNVFTIRGEPCRRKLKIQPLVNILPNGRPNKTFVLGHNSLLLENVELSGFDYISFVNDGIAPAVGLSGDASADLYSEFLDSRGYFGTAMNFFIEGINNDLILRQDGFVLYGNIAFGDFADNDLNVRFNLAAPLLSTTRGRTDVLDGFPFVILQGDPGIYLYSGEGVARLNFADFNACVRNATPSGNGFVTDANSLLTFSRLQILDNPIKQQSALFRFEGLELIGERIDPSFIRLPSNMSRSAHMVVSAIFLKRQQEKLDFLDAQEKAQKLAKQKASYVAGKTAHKQAVKKNKKQMPKPKLHRSFDPSELGIPELLINDQETRSMKAVVTRGTEQLPTSLDQSYVGVNYKPIATTLSGNLEFDHSNVDFKVITPAAFDPNTPFNYVIKNSTNSVEGTKVSFGDSATLVSTVHKFNIVGKGNSIEVPAGKILRFGQDTLLFADDSEVTFSAIPGSITPAFIKFDDNISFGLAKGAMMRFAGNIHCIVGQGNTWNFMGTKTGGAVSSRATVEVKDGALIYVYQGTNAARFTGVGKISAVQNGTIAFNYDGDENVEVSTGSLILGLDTSTTDGLLNGTPSVDTQDFEIIINGANFKAKNGDVQNPTGLSMRYGTFNFACEGRSYMEVGKNSFFQMNSDGTKSMSGNVKSFSLRGATLVVGKDSLWSIGDNAVDITTGNVRDFLFNSSGLGISGDGGLLSYFPAPGKGDSFLNAHMVIPGLIRDRSLTTASELAGVLVQQGIDFTTAVWFTDANGISFVRLKDGKIYQLKTGDYITGELPDGSVKGDNSNDGYNFYIDINTGQRYEEKRG